jgi:hypothetical protein
LIAAAFMALSTAQTAQPLPGPGADRDTRGTGCLEAADNTRPQSAALNDTGSAARRSRASSRFPSFSAIALPLRLNYRFFSV